MSTTVSFLLAVCAVAFVTHQATVVSQCTTKHCHSGDTDMSALTALDLVTQLQDTVERQQDVLEQQRNENDEQHTQLVILRETVEQQQRCNQELQRLFNDSLEQLQQQNQEQQKQLARIEETLAKQDKMLTRRMVVKDCLDILKDGNTISGVYEVYLDKAQKFVKIFCDLDTDNGGWLVFQRRQDGSVDFYRDWADYKAGFGDLTGEFWLGNDLLHAVTSQRHYTLRIDMEDFQDASRFAVYQNFEVSSESNKFRVSFGSYSGTAGDSFSREVGSAFSTRDRDNDEHSDHCAQEFKGAWWYRGCHEANLNGLYLRGSHTSYADGIVWRYWHGYHYSLKNVTMKLRPRP